MIAVDFLSANQCSGGISNSEWDTQDHGTHVAGTVAGDNFANLLTHNTADGMAPGAKLVIQDAVRPRGPTQNDLVLDVLLGERPQPLRHARLGSPRFDHP
ncbi:MAG TPA: S8 family serine peptidase [Thermoanaerobaculia bacterium]|nr:S8 family serine peptidase [Thermoanaerobaculia bacterium]